MKTIFTFFLVAIVLFATYTINHGNCQTMINDAPSVTISTQKIVDEISPFIDEDTAIICYVNLIALKDIYKLVGITEKLAKVESFPDRIRKHLMLLGQRIDRKKVENFCNELLENNVTHLYVILNMRDLKFGAYFVIPDVCENSDKAKCIEKFFNTRNDPDGAGKHQTWSVYAKNSMIIAGSSSISFFSVVYFADSLLLQMLPTVGEINAICGYYNLSPSERRKYINQRFKNFKPAISENFKRGIKEVDDCNLLKTVFLFPDSVTTWELLHLKKMDTPLNQVTFDFLKTSRDYVALGVDTKLPKVKLIVQCKSHEEAIKFKKLIDNVWWNIVNNYFTYPLLHTTLNKDGKSNDQNLMTPNELADFIVSLLPETKGNQLVTIVDQNYKQ